MRTLIIFIALAMAGQVAGQSWNQEIETAAAKLAAQLKMHKVKLTGVADFTYNGQANTQIGKMLADRLSGQMTVAGLIMKEREEFRKALAKSSNQAPSQPDIPIDDTSVEQAKILTNKEASQQAKDGVLIQMGADILGDIANRPANPLKGIDAIVYANIVSMGDNLEITFSGMRNNKNKEQIGYAIASLSKTPDLMELIGGSGGVMATVPGPVVSDPQMTPKTTFDGISDVTPFKHEILTFEMVGCSQINRSVECKLRIISSRQDYNLSVFFSYYGNNTRFLDAATGVEFYPSEIQLAELSSTQNGVTKTLVADHGIDAIFRFTQVSRKISSISMMEIACRGFTAKLSNIPVN